MITTQVPENWRALQRDTAQILNECGIDATTEKTVTLARGHAEVDVYAVETVRGRTNTIFCECKLWNASIPQNVIHAFRSVVADGGANVGYVITSSAYQRGAFAAAELTNLRLVTWAEFQAEFEPTWLSRYLRPQVTQRLDALMSLVEPILPRAFEELDDQRKREFIELRERYFDLGALVMLFTTYVEMFNPGLPDLPLRGRFRPTSKATEMPSEILDATAYRDLLDVLIPFGERAISGLRAALRSSDADARAVAES